MSEFAESIPLSKAEDIVDALDTLHLPNEQDHSDAEEEKPTASGDDSSANLYYVKSLEIAIEAKEEGNNFFRNKDYDESLESYSRAITFCPEDEANKDNLATFYGNRAAAYFSLEEYELVVEDCTAAIALKADYVKVLARRMLANEKLEKYEEALTGRADFVVLLYAELIFKAPALLFQMFYLYFILTIT